MKKQIIISFLGLTMWVNASEFYYSNGKAERQLVMMSGGVG